MGPHIPVSQSQIIPESPNCLSGLILTFDVFKFVAPLFLLKLKNLNTTLWSRRQRIYAHVYGQ